MSNKIIRAFQVLTIEEIETLAFIGSMDDCTDKGAFFLGRFATRRLATARRLEASAAPADVEEARRLRLVARVSMEEAVYLGDCCVDGEDPSASRERICKTPLTVAFAVAEVATYDLERAWAEAYASGRPISQLIGPLARIHDGKFRLARGELAHLLTTAWGEGRAFSEVIDLFSPARGVKGRLIAAITLAERREPTPVPFVMGSGSEACRG
jgi:hypothetical protein